jgi:hypothetical protein
VKRRGARRADRPDVDGGAADHGPRERAQHGTLVARETMVAGLIGRRVKHECRLDWYWDRCSIVDRQHEAGIRFRRDWAFATARPTVTSRYGPRLTSHAEFSEQQLAARRRLAAAIQKLGGEAARIVIEVCCYDNWAAERLPRLREALSLLADHYGLPARATTRRSAE